MQYLFPEAVVCVRLCAACLAEKGLTCQTEGNSKENPYSSRVFCLFFLARSIYTLYTVAENISFTVMQQGLKRYKSLERAPESAFMY